MSVAIVSEGCDRSNSRLHLHLFSTKTHVGKCMTTTNWNIYRICPIKMTWLWPNIFSYYHMLWRQCSQFKLGLAVRSSNRLPLVSPSMSWRITHTHITHNVSVSIIVELIVLSTVRISHLATNQFYAMLQIHAYFVSFWQIDWFKCSSTSICIWNRFLFADGQRFLLKISKFNQLCLRQSFHQVHCHAGKLVCSLHLLFVHSNTIVAVVATLCLNVATWFVCG